jgi:hypothetical protein
VLATLDLFELRHHVARMRPDVGEKRRFGCRSGTRMTGYSSSSKRDGKSMVEEKYQLARSAGHEIVAQAITVSVGGARELPAT